MANQKLTELSEDATPLDTDLTYGVKDPIGSPSSIKWSWSTLKTFLKTYFDTLYQLKLVSGTSIKTVNSTSLLGSGNIVTPNTTYTASSFDIKDLTDSTALRSSWTGKQDNLGFTPEDVSNKQTNLTASATKYPTVNAVNTGLSGKQNTLGYTAENNANKKTSLADNSDTFYPTQKAVKTAVDAKQDTLAFTPENSANKENSTIDTSTTKYPTVNLLKTVKDSIPVKASGAVIDTGTDDAKFATAKALADSKYVKKDETAILTNKRINPRLVTAASYTTDTGTSLSVATCDQFEVTAQAGALKFNNPGGTPTEGQKLIIRIKDNGTARALTYDTQFRAMGNALPTTTVLGKTLYMGFIFNATDTKWDLVAVAQEA